MDFEQWFANQVSNANIPEDRMALYREFARLSWNAGLDHAVSLANQDSTIMDSFSDIENVCSCAKA